MTGVSVQIPKAKRTINFAKTNREIYWEPVLLLGSYVQLPIFPGRLNLFQPIVFFFLLLGFKTGRKIKVSLNFISLYSPQLNLFNEIQGKEPQLRGLESS